jgi:3-oxoacyl-[acyl-carrier protein] reductase
VNILTQSRYNIKLSLVFSPAISLSNSTLDPLHLPAMANCQRLAGKTAIVTGASRGIGRAIALALAAEGANVVINYASSARSAEEVVQTIGADRALAVQGDMSDTSAVKTLVAKTVERFGAINILVLNAGLLAADKSLEKTEEGDYERMFATNVKGPMFLTKVSEHRRPTVSLSMLGL